MKSFLKKIEEFFLPNYEDVLETLDNGEEIVVKEIIVPPGFVMFLILMIVWAARAL